MQSILTVVQARTGSSRLPGKVLLPLGDSTVLLQMVHRISEAHHAGRVVVATTWEPEDEEIVRMCEREGVACFRGHPTDCLARHYEAWRAFPAEAVVKIPSDCPLIDPKIVDRVIGAYLLSNGGYDYLSNLHPQSYPDGNDVEVMSAQALETAHREATREIEREHTTPFLWDNPERFRIGNITWELGLDLSRTHRWTLDYWEDYCLIQSIFDELHGEKPSFGVEDIVQLLDRKPELRHLNESRLGDSWYARHAEELKTAPPELALLTTPGATSSPERVIPLPI